MEELQADALRYNAIDDLRIKHLQEIPVFASRLSNSSEPSLSWDSLRKSYDTAAIRSQLINLAKNNTDRAVLELNIEKLKHSQQVWSGSWTPSRNFSFHDGNFSTKTVVRCRKWLLIFSFW